MFEKVLIANRGEIAVRVAHACHELGIGCVAVYSEPDRLSPHVMAADEAVPIGPAPASESYLDPDKLIEAARATGAGAIHPGYGFLAESPAFAARVEQAGIVFVGPSANAIQTMGDKTAARATMLEAGVPVVPGTEEPVSSAEGAVAAANRLGYPVMLKAAAGGGGKGMRTAEDHISLAAEFPRAEREASQAFGDGRLYLERLLTEPRHVEIQVLADTHGSTVHLGERECSVQRRHQKLIEEAPSPALDPGLRARMGEVAVRAAKAVGYRGAGTVEFLLQDGDFFFLEMNTRIQVEHPVTEMVTGVDLVREQLRIARGERIDWPLDPEWPRGHSIECRISAEEPFNGFLPSTGRVERLHIPSGPGVRWDSGIAEGFEVGLHYDPLLAKLIVHADDRKAAIRRMKRALTQLRIAGVATTQPYHLAVMEEADFNAGEYSTRYVQEHEELLRGDIDPELLEAAALAAVILERQASAGSAGALVGRAPAPGRQRPRQLSAWRRLYGPDP